MECRHGNFWIGCIQWLKDTNLKANHNDVIKIIVTAMLYSMAQRY